MNLSRRAGTHTTARTGGGDQLLLALAIQRMNFLTPPQKLLVLDLVRKGASFRRLTRADLETATGRNLSAFRWEPDRLLSGAERDLELMERKGIRYVSRDDAEYPPQLRIVAQAPFGLYVRGRLPDPWKPAVAIVGTRIATLQGLRGARDLARDISGEGLCVVSGLARGIDAAAHRGALEGPGGTCAVLPCGPERIYPPQNRSLASLIVDSGGSLVTEYPPETEMHRYRFPERNRIIAGMARTCVVVEAPEGSGALITADHALTEGREVFLYEGCRGSVRNAGADALGEQGAQNIGHFDDLLAQWSAVRTATAPSNQGVQ